MRKVIRGSFIIFLLVIMTVTSFAAENVKIVINGGQLQVEDPLVSQNGMVYISLRDIGNAFGYEFSWQSEKKTANLKSENVIIALQPDNRWYTKKVRDKEIVTFKFNEGHEPKMINNKVYVPVTNFTIVSDGMIAWDGSNSQYNIIHGWNLNYSEKLNAKLYAGTGKKGLLDGELLKSKFQYAQSIYASNNNEIYIVDAGTIRKMSGSTVQTLNYEPSHIKVSSLKGKDNAIYALSTVYENSKKEKEVGIFKLEDNQLTPVLIEDGSTQRMIDFDLLATGEIVVLKETLKTKKRSISVFDIKGNRVVETEIDSTFNCLAAGNKTVYLGDSTRGTIYSYDIKTKELKLFAGSNNEHQFIDGKAPRFCAPKKLKYVNGALYVLDYNMIRKMSIVNEKELGVCQSVAGKVSALINPKMGSGKAADMYLSIVNPIDFTVTGKGLFVVDANQYKVMVIN